MKLFLRSSLYVVVTTVLFGKHIDKIEADTKLGVRTLPVILGEARARTVGAWLMILFYPLTLLVVLTGLVGPWVGLVVLGSLVALAPLAGFVALLVIHERVITARRRADAWTAAFEKRAGLMKFGESVSLRSPGVAPVPVALTAVLEQ